MINCQKGRSWPSVLE